MQSNETSSIENCTNKKRVPNFIAYPKQQYNALDKRSRIGVQLIVWGLAAVIVLLGFYLYELAENGSRAVSGANCLSLLSWMGVGALVVAAGAGLLKKYRDAIKLALFACVLLYFGPWFF